jgi:glycosyltransferase involved in cell wall biosynthesis
MRVLVLCKRQYTGKDLLDDRYGRLFELPVALASRGHEVTVLAASYRPKGNGSRVEEQVNWHSIDVFRTPFGYRQRLRGLIADMRPDVLWPSSDVLHVIEGGRQGRKNDIPVVIDLYDDYESFRLTSALGLAGPFRQACAKAAALSVVSQTLVETVKMRTPGVGPMAVIGNGVPEGFAVGAPRDQARRQLGLPLDAALVGTAGALDGSRGIDDLLHAFTHLRRHRPNVRLVLAGPRDGSSAAFIAKDAGVIDLGLLAHNQVPWLYSALDVGVVCNRDSDFGRACHPQKLVEMAACGLPMVVAAVGDAAIMLDQANLYMPGDALALSHRIEQQLDSPSRAPSSIALRWSELAVRLEAILQEAIDQFQTGPASV